MNQPDFKINGLYVQPQMIANGLYEIICKAGEDHIVAFGMIPAWVMEMTEKNLRDKVIKEAAKQVCCTSGEIEPILDEKLIQDTIRPIMHAISLGIYEAASKAGMLRV
jgi:hypothetical protein